MCKNRSVLSLIAVACSSTLRAAKEWDYKMNGKDWPLLEIDGNKCGCTNQSPIDLKTTGWPVVDSDMDNFQKIYTNQKGDIPIRWTGYTTKVEINKAGQDLQTFYSELGKSKLNGNEGFTGV